jgi:hypothetical protein
MGNLKFIRFTNPIIRVDKRKRKRALYKCICGNEVDLDWSSVNTGHTSQCQKCSDKSRIKNRITHNLIKHPLYRKWQDMKNRCYNPNVGHYKNYGKRGVVVCDLWKKDFYSFYCWCINNGWKLELQIDRKDVNGNYTPDNCKFSTALEQGFNKTNTFYIYYNDIRYGLSELLYKNNLSSKYGTIWQGLKKGKKIDYYIDKFNIQMG